MDTNQGPRNLPKKLNGRCGGWFASNVMGAMHNQSCRQKVQTALLPPIEGTRPTTLRDLIGDIVRNVDLANWKHASGVTASVVTSKLENDLRSGAFFVTILINRFRNNITAMGYKIKNGYAQRRLMIASRGLYKMIHKEITNLPFNEILKMIEQDIVRRYRRDHCYGCCLSTVEVSSEKEEYKDIFETTLAADWDNYRDAEECHLSDELISEVARDFAERVFTGSAFKKLRHHGRENVRLRMEQILKDMAVRTKGETNQQIVGVRLAELNPIDISRLFRARPSARDGKRGDVWESMKRVAQANPQFREYYWKKS